jgi:hypothetical protein
LSVYVDELVAHAPPKEAQARRTGAKHGQRWCHMMADTHEELLAMARKIGLRPEWIQKEDTHQEHFDLVPPRRAAAVAAGALEVTTRDLVALGFKRLEHAKALLNG